MRLQLSQFSENLRTGCSPLSSSTMSERHERFSASLSQGLCFVHCASSLPSAASIVLGPQKHMNEQQWTAVKSNFERLVSSGWAGQDTDAHVKASHQKCTPQRKWNKYFSGSVPRKAPEERDWPVLNLLHVTPKSSSPHFLLEISLLFESSSAPKSCLLESNRTLLKGSLGMGVSWLWELSLKALQDQCQILRYYINDQGFH